MTRSVKLDDGASTDERATAEGPPEETQPSYEEARDELLDVVRRLEQGGASLEESLALWERGERLAGLCQDLLDRARERVEAAVAARPGSDD